MRVFGENSNLAAKFDDVLQNLEVISLAGGRVVDTLEGSTVNGIIYTNIPLPRI